MLHVRVNIYRKEVISLEAPKKFRVIHWLRCDNILPPYCRLWYFGFHRSKFHTSRISMSFVMVMSKYLIISCMRALSSPSFIFFRQISLYHQMKCTTNVQTLCARYTKRNFYSFDFWYITFLDCVPFFHNIPNSFMTTGWCETTI